MTCRLASLPEEILTQIVDNLCLRSIARLMRCRTKLYLRLEPHLLKSDVARNLAMKWACKRASPDHAATVLRRLVRDYGVSPSVLEIPTGKPDDSGQRMMTRKVFTGALAMRAGRVDILPVLAYLGASLDDPVLRRDNYRLRFNWPFRSASPDWGMVRAFIETGWPRQLSHRLLGRLLINLIIFKASPYLIDRVIDMGADVNLVTDYGGDAWISPLGATVLMDSALTFRRLIARGASLSIKAIDDSKRNALHCPLSVAVGKISERGLDLVDLCLEFGANINQKVFRTEHKDPVIVACTPLARYLSSKRSSAPNPVVVKYFIEKGALVKLIPQYDQPRLLNPPSLITLLLESWPYYSVVSLLAQQPAQEVIKLLVQHGAADGCILDLIMHWVYPDSRGWGSRGRREEQPLKAYLRPFEAYFKPWRAFIDTLLQASNTAKNDKQHRDLMDRTLHNYICYKSARIENLCPLALITIRHLVYRGGDINARIGDDGATALHAACGELHRGNYEKYWYDHDRTDFLCQKSSDLVKVMLDEGADPSLTTDRGETAIDILRAHKKPQEHVRKRHASIIASVLAAIHGSDADVASATNSSMCNSTPFWLRNGHRVVENHIKPPREYLEGRKGSQ